MSVKASVGCSIVGSHLVTTWQWVRHVLASQRGSILYRDIAVEWTLERRFNLDVRDIRHVDELDKRIAELYSR